MENTTLEPTKYVGMSTNVDASHLTNILVRTRFQNLGFCGSKY